MRFILFFLTALLLCALDPAAAAQSSKVPVPKKMETSKIKPLKWQAGRQLRPRPVDNGILITTPSEGAGVVGGDVVCVTWAVTRPAAASEIIFELVQGADIVMSLSVHYDPSHVVADPDATLMDPLRNNNMASIPFRISR